MIPAIRTERGPGHRSWVRVATTGVLDKLFTDPSLWAAKRLFISPFKAQAKVIDSYLANNFVESWTASTVHSQQGSEADIVIFDSVNAGSYSWPYNEWKRLVNVALRRSREAIVVLSSLAEMEGPYLRPLLKELSPRVLRKRGSQITWEEVALRTDFALSNGESFLNMPVGSLHCFRNESDKTARLLISLAPAGLEEMFSEVGTPLADDAETAPPPSEGEIKKLLDAAPRYGVEIKVPHE